MYSLSPKNRLTVLRKLCETAKNTRTKQKITSIFAQRAPRRRFCTVFFWKEDEKQFYLLFVDPAGKRLGECRYSHHLWMSVITFLVYNPFPTEKTGKFCHFAQNSRHYFAAEPRSFNSGPATKTRREFGTHVFSIGNGLYKLVDIIKFGFCSVKLSCTGKKKSNCMWLCLVFKSLALLYSALLVYNT